MKEDLEYSCINTIRALAVDAIEKANSGHPGAPMGMAPAAYVLFTHVMKHNPLNPNWENRDRFILSAGHASMLLYSMLYLTGYDISLDDLKNFRQWNSRTPGHPEYGHTPGVETTTGPLGQGIANAVGMAMAERFLASLFNRPGHEIVDHHTYVMCGDGDLMEGVCAEAASLAGHMGLGRLICLYDDNKISIEGCTDITFTENVSQRFEAYGWQVLEVEDGNDTRAIFNAIQTAKNEEDKPSLIKIRSQIAFGSPNKQGSCNAHGAPLGEDEVRLTKANLGCPDQDFCVPQQVLSHFRQCQDNGAYAQVEWQDRVEAYKEAYPDEFEAYGKMVLGELSPQWDKDIPEFVPEDGPIATRAASGKVLNSIAPECPSLVGGSADLAPSNKTYIDMSGDFQKDAYQNRNIRFGVREHAMASICAGMALHKGVVPYCGTFLVFADYMRPAIRMAALMRIPVTYVFTHDSIAVGEDGPTHQPVEHVASLRSIPGLTVIRPADANETAEAWRQAITGDTPTALILSRQKLPIIDRKRYSPASGLAKGAYVLADGGDRPDLILIATGSEVHLALKARMKLIEKGLAPRVVCMPSWELFDRQPIEYQETVLPSAIRKRIVIEAASPFGWERYSGRQGIILGIDHFGASAPGNILMEKFGFTVERIVKESLSLMGK